MSIHRTKSSTYRVRWRECGRIKSKTFKRKVDAEKFEAEITLGEFSSQVSKPSSICFEEFCQIWLRDHAEVHKTPSSVVRDRQMTRDFILPLIGRKSLPAITCTDVIRLQADLKRSGRLSDKSINNVVGLLHKMLSDAVRWGYLKQNPAAQVKRIEVPDKDYHFWSFDERDRFLSYAKTHNKELHDLVAVAVFTGMRRGEVHGLCRDAVDLDRRIIIVKRSYCDKTKQLNEYTKSKKVRRIPMNDVVWKILRERSLVPLGNMVFHQNFHNLVTDRLKPACRQAGVTVITFHDLRHTFASHMALVGVSALKIKEILGHCDLNITQRYMHLAPNDLDGVTDVLLKPRRSMEAQETQNKCSFFVPSTASNFSMGLESLESYGAQGGT